MLWSPIKRMVLLTAILQFIMPANVTNADVNVVGEQDLKIQLETNLLSLFGMTKRPRPARKDIVIPTSMLELYKKHSGMEFDSTNLVLPGRYTKSANTVRSFTHQESPVDKQFLHHHRFRLYFTLDSIPKSEELKAAELQLSRVALTNSKHRTQNILVYDIIKPGVKRKSTPLTRLIDVKTVNVNENTNIKLDVTPAVHRWLDNPKDNHGLLVIVVVPKLSDRNTSDCVSEELTDIIKTQSTKHVRLKRSSEDVGKWREMEPLLFTYTDDGKYKQNTETLVTRSRRAVKRHKLMKRNQGRDHCKRHPLYVDFSDVGWTDWIVAPPGYEAYFCSGDCPFPLSDHLNTTNHAIVQTLVNSVNAKAAPKACCVPTSLAPISMLYLDEENNVVLKNYQDMTILGCGCR